MLLVFILSLIIHPVYIVQFDSPLRVIATVIDVLCLCDVLITFFTGYGIYQEKEVILIPQKIFRYKITY